jgi:hypothetical protein
MVHYTAMVYQVSKKYTNMIVKKFGRDWKSVVEGISEAKI